jgi:hypothetical protein
MAERTPPKLPKAPIARYMDLLDQIEEVHIAPQGTASSDIRDKEAASTVATTPSIDINNEIAREQKLKNDDVEQDITLKRTTLNRLFVFLTAETILIFTFAFFQAIEWPFDFHLEEWSFKLVLTVTILQITGMLYVAVRYLFPKGR